MLNQNKIYAKYAKRNIFSPKIPDYASESQILKHVFIIHQSIAMNVNFNMSKIIIIILHTSIISNIII